MKKNYMFLLNVFVVILFLSITFFSVKAEVNSSSNTIVTEEKNYILADINQEINMSNVVVRGTFGNITLSTTNITSEASEVTISDGKLKANTKGVFTLNFSYLENSFPIYLITKNESENEYILYEENFDGFSDGNIPDNFELVSGTAGIKDGALFLNATTTSPTLVLLPSFLKTFSNYIIESDFTIKTVKEPTRWTSLVFRYEPNNYYQMAIRQGATATNGVEFAKSINNVWNVPTKAGFTESINSNNWYKLKIEVKGTNINEYINNQKLVTYEEATEFSTGKIGMQANGSEAFYDNIKISLPVDYVNNDENIYNVIPSVYEPETNIKVPASVIKPINSLSDIEAVIKEVRPATVIFNINSNLEVLDDKGNYLMSITDALNYITGLVIPAFNVSDGETAVNIAKFLKDNKIKDVFVMSTNPEIVKEAREEYNMCRGIIKFTYDENKPLLSVDDLLNIRKITNEAKATIALLPNEYITKNNVFYLQKRLVTVWGDASNGTISTNYKVILSGVNGIITNDFENIFDIYKKFPENSYVRQPLIIGHRGIPSLAPENTIEGAKLAFEKGADVVELDIHLTKDNEVVVFHDFTTGRLTDKDLKIMDTTLEQLKELTFKDTTGNYPNVKIPTLKEFLDAFKTDDVMFFIEIKNYDTSIVNKLKQILEEYNALDNVVVISFIEKQINEMNNVLPEISNGLLSYSGLITDQNVTTSVSNVLNAVVPINTTINPSYVGVNNDFVRAISHRGITVWPWTLNDSVSINNFYLMGVGGITTNNCDYLYDTWTDLVMKKSHIEYVIYKNAKDLKNISLEGQIVTGGGLQYDYVPSFEIIDDGGTEIELSDIGVIKSAKNPGIALIKVHYKSTFPDGNILVLYSDLVTVEIKQDIEKDKSGFNYMFLYLGLGTIALGGAGFIGFKLITSRKK